MATMLRSLARPLLITGTLGLVAASTALRIKTYWLLVDLSKEIGKIDSSYYEDPRDPGSRPPSFASRTTVPEGARVAPTRVTDSGPLVGFSPRHHGEGPRG